MMNGEGLNAPGTAEEVLAAALTQAELVIRDGKVAEGLELYLDLIDEHPGNVRKWMSTGMAVAYNLGDEKIKTPDEAMEFLLGLSWHQEEKQRREAESANL